MPEEDQEGQEGRQRFDPRREVLLLLLDRVEEDRFPSSTMLDAIEQLLEDPRDVQDYVEVLLDKISGDRFPSVSMIARAMSVV